MKLACILAAYFAGVALAGAAAYVTLRAPILTLAAAACFAWKWDWRRASNAHPWCKTLHPGEERASHK